MLRRCTIIGAVLACSALGAVVPASAVALTTQTVTFTMKPPAKAFVGGSAKVAAEASSGLPVLIKTSSTACEVTGAVEAAKAEATVAFTQEGACVVEAEQAGDGTYSAATETETVTVGKKESQTVTFTMKPPATAFVGSSAKVAAAASSGLPVLIKTSSTACEVKEVVKAANAEATVAFTQEGSCVVEAEQAGSEQFAPAPKASQSVTVTAPPPVVTVVPGPGPKPPPPPPPAPTPTTGNSNFTAGKSAFEPKTGRVIFYETISDAGRFTWLLTVPNGKFGVFASARKKCNTGLVRLSGRCRPSRVIFATGSASVPAGVVIFKLRPSPNALKAMKNALKKSRGLLVTATFTFQSSRGGSPVTHTQTLRVKLAK